MRKRVAIFANGWGYEYLQAVVNGVYECAKKENVDIFTFVNYSTQGEAEADRKGEFNTYTLPALQDFDGVLLMANSFNNPDEIGYLHNKLLETAVPAISLEYELPGLDFLGTDNYSGMFELAEHLIVRHAVKNILFIGGPKGHAEGDIRQQAVIDAAKKYGIEIPKENIAHGDWADEGARRIVHSYLTSGNKMPDAIICANDNMAMGVCSYMEENGYRVPGNVRVASFDCLEDGQIFYPALTTVNRCWDKMGYQGLRLLLRKITGEKIPERTIVNSHFECGESCGCKLSEEKNHKRLKAARDTYARRITSMSQDAHYRSLYLYMRRCKTAEELHGSLSHMLGTYSEHEGSNFLFCLEPNFFTAKEDSELRTDGYSIEADAIYSMVAGQVAPLRRIHFMEEIFRQADASEIPRVYVTVALHNEDKSFGYAVFATGIHIVDGYVLYKWSRHMNQYLEQVRQNAKIEALTESLRESSVTDVLTGVFNRVGCEKMIYPYLEECFAKGEVAALMIIDVDRMKDINDIYGHLQGDTALRTVAGVLRTVLPEDWIVARYGGDEFLAAGRCRGEEHLAELQRNIAIRLAKEASDMQISFELTVSTGSVMIEDGTEFSLEKYVRIADERMYAVKKIHHLRKGV